MKTILLTILWASIALCSSASAIEPPEFVRIPNEQGSPAGKNSWLILCSRPDKLNHSKICWLTVQRTNKIGDMSDFKIFINNEEVIIAQVGDESERMPGSSQSIRIDDQPVVSIDWNKAFLFTKDHYYLWEKILAAKTLSTKWVSFPRGVSFTESFDLTGLQQALDKAKIMAKQI
ncbi:MAG: hypothetical protein QE263_00505 [Vampirovibrionales bacterium]|nr:hypothetical protein [Vampirovibrionales bacterium]